MKQKLFILLISLLSLKSFSKELKHDDFFFYEREKGMFSSDLQSDYITIHYEGKRDFSYYGKERINVSSGEIYKFTCEARNLLDNNCTLQISAFNNNEVIDYSYAVSEGIIGDSWETYSCVCIIGSNINQIQYRIIGSGISCLQIKNLEIKKGLSYIDENLLYDCEFQNIGKINQRKEVDRSLSAVPGIEGSVLISWRRFSTDNDNTMYKLYRERDGKRETIPINLNDTKKTSFIDLYSESGDIYILYINDTYDSETSKENNIYKTIKLQNTDGFERIACEDLNGDGKLDFIVKGPHGTIDPYFRYHKPSEKMYFLAAYDNDGSFLWKKDLGYNIESGIWYSPFIVADLDCDGKAEIILKTGENSDKIDYRDKFGRVTKGPEYLTILDGMTGEEIVKTDWISRKNYENYNLASRNQLAIAYLDGITPYIIEIRGTYGLIQVCAYRFFKTPKIALRKVFSFSNAILGKKYRGQGAHQTLCVDVDDDGCDEIILGSTVLDNDGSILWNLGKGHPDGIYFGDFNPNNPGNEIVYLYETKQKSGGIIMVDAKTGNIIWQLNEPTSHVHGRGFCADVFPEFEGFEIFGRECVGDHEFSEKCWLFSGTGEILNSGKELHKEHPEWDYSPVVLYWDSLPLKKVYSKQLIKTKGYVIMAVDIYGDWREELITSSGDEIRIYCTPYPTEYSYPWLLTDKNYNSIIKMNTSGYIMYPSVFFE